MTELLEIDSCFGLLVVILVREYEFSLTCFCKFNYSQKVCGFSLFFFYLKR